MPIPSNGRIFWTGTHAGVPSGWTRDTNFDDRFVQGANGDVEPGTNGGAATHVHTSVAHNHTQSQHDHTLAVRGTSGSRVVAAGLVSAAVGIAHGHNKSAPIATATNQTATPTINATAAKPIFTRVIIIKPNDALQDIPVDGIVLANSDVSDTDLKITDGLNSTTDLDGDFLHGMTTGGDGGGTGGSANHNHTSPAHNHTQDAHNHGAGSSGAASGFNPFHQTGGQQASHRTHAHTITYGNTTATNQATAMSVDNASSEPAFIELLGIQNKGAGVVEAPVGVIIAYVGNINTIPSPWKLCNGASGTPDCQGRQIKVTKTVGNIGNTGGANTHTHTSPSHNHTQDSHTHSLSTATGTPFAAVRSGRTGPSAAITGHRHTWSHGSTVATNTAKVATMSTDDIRYLYREVLFIMLVNEPTVHVKGGAIQGATIL